MNEPVDVTKMSDAELFLKCSRILRKWYTKNGDGHETDMPYLQEVQTRLLRLIHELTSREPPERTVRIAKSAFETLRLGDRYYRSKMIETFASMCFHANIVVENRLDDEARKHLAELQTFCTLFRDVLEVEEAEDEH